MSGEERADGMEVVRNEAEERWEVREDGHLAYLTWGLMDGRLFLLHTEVPEALGGRGIAGALLRTAMEWAAEREMEVVPFCPFAKTWLRRHDEYAHLVRAGGEDG